MSLFTRGRCDLRSRRGARRALGPPEGQEAPDEANDPDQEDTRAIDLTGLDTDDDAAVVAGESIADDDMPDDTPHAAPEDSERTIRVARKRFARRQWARRWLAWRRVLVAVLLVGLVAGSVWLVFFSSVLAVSGVQVAGTEVLTPAAVRRTAQVPLGGPLATVDLDAVTARVEGLPAVKSVDVSRSWPDKVLVKVTERRAVAVVESGASGGRLRGTDADGVLFRTYATRPSGLPVIRTGRRTGSTALGEAAQVAGSLPPDLAAKVANVSVDTVDTITLDLRSGRKVRWGSSADSVSKARVLAALLPQKAAYYDVSVPGQPIIRQ